MSNHPAVICASCHREFEGIFPDDETQAYDCSGEVVVERDRGFRIIRCNYGSDYDNLWFLLKGNSQLSLGVVCDACIRSELGWLHATLWKDLRDYYCPDADERKQREMQDPIFCATPEKLHSAELQVGQILQRIRLRMRFD